MIPAMGTATTQPGRRQAIATTTGDKGNTNVRVWPTPGGVGTSSLPPVPPAANRTGCGKPILHIPWSRPCSSRPLFHTNAKFVRCGRTNQRFSTDAVFSGTTVKKNAGLTLSHHISVDISLELDRLAQITLELFIFLTTHPTHGNGTTPPQKKTT